MTTGPRYAFRKLLELVRDFDDAAEELGEVEFSLSLAGANDEVRLARRAEHLRTEVTRKKPLAEVARVALSWAPEEAKR